jgi:allene oxide cyclase
MLRSLKLAQSSSLLSIIPIAAASLMVAGSAAADPQELKVTEHNTTQVVTDVGASGDSPGDILTFGQNEVFDADDKNKVGFDQGICYRIVAGKVWECIWTLGLEKGQLTVEGPFYDTSDSVLAITGGTGEYAGARGEMALSDVSGGKGEKYSFTYKIQ